MYSTFIQFYSWKVLLLKRSAFLLLFLFLLPLYSICQTDSLPKHGTIKIGKAKDSVSIKATIGFNVYPNSNQKNISTIKQFEKFILGQKPSDSINCKQPRPFKDDNFNFETYLSQKSTISADNLLGQETDTINIKITILKDGTYKYTDLETGTEATKKGIKTKSEFQKHKQLTTNMQIMNTVAPINNWNVAKILEPKRVHFLSVGKGTIGFRNRNKLFFYPANSSGILTIIVSKE